MRTFMLACRRPSAGQREACPGKRELRPARRLLEGNRRSVGKQGSPSQLGASSFGVGGEENYPLIPAPGKQLKFPTLLIS